MKMQLIENLSRRERQIMDAIYSLGEASVSDVREILPDPPSYSSVRTLLGVLENKGFVRHKRRGRAYVYIPTLSHEKARRSALSHVMQTFFDGSVERVVAALMSLRGAELTDEDYERLAELIRRKREEEESK